MDGFAGSIMNISFDFKVCCCFALLGG